MTVSFKIYFNIKSQITSEFRFKNDIFLNILELSGHDDRYLPAVSMRAHCTGLELSRQHSRSGLKITFWDSLPKCTCYQSMCYFSSVIMLTV